MNKRIRAAEEKVIAEARVIHGNGWGRGTTYGLGEAFRELNEAERDAARRKTKKRGGSGGIGIRAGFKIQ